MVQCCKQLYNGRGRRKVRNGSKVTELGSYVREKVMRRKTSDAIQYDSCL